MNSFPYPPSPVQRDRDAAVGALRDLLSVYDAGEGGDVCVRMTVIARAALARLGELTPPCPADALDFGADPNASADDSSIDFGDFPAA
jgi:hypothetical protein